VNPAPLGAGREHQMATRHVHPEPTEAKQCAPNLERAARTALESRCGRTFTDVEWARMRARLLEFENILGAWDRQAGTSRANTKGTRETEPRCPQDY
jgi:hypothetical protein